MGPSESPRLWPEETSDLSLQFMRVVQTCFLNTVGMDMGRLSSPKRRTDIPGMLLQGRQGREGTPQSIVGAEQLLRARHTGWVILSRERTGAGSKESHLE